MKRVAWTLVAVLAALTGVTATAQPPLPLVAAVGADMNHVPSFVGVEKGIFLRHGIDLKLRVLSTGQEMAEALQAGEAQIIGAAFSNYLVAVERGLAARGVVGLLGDRTVRHSDDPASVWTRRGTGIATIEDLAGRTVGTPIGGTGHEYLGAVLKKAGLARDQVSLVNVPPGAIVSMLQSGGVDAVAIWEPFGALVEARVPDAVLVTRGGGHIGYYINMAVRTDLIEVQPETVERYVIGMAEASQYARQNLEEAAEIATRWVPGLDTAVARQALRHMSFDPRITIHTVAAWEENVRILIEEKKLRTALPWQQGIELRFIENVMRTYPQLFTDLNP